MSTAAAAGGTARARGARAVFVEKGDGEYSHYCTAVET